MPKLFIVVSSIGKPKWLYKRGPCGSKKQKQEHREPLLVRLLACKVDSWSQSVIDYQRGRKEGGSFRPFTRLSSASIRGWPRPEKIPSTPDDWLVVIKHSMEFAFVVVKSGRLGCFENKRPIFTWSRESKEAIRRKVTKVLTRLSRRTLSKTQTHTRC